MSEPPISTPTAMQTAIRGRVDEGLWASEIVHELGATLDCVLAVMREDGAPCAKCCGIAELAKRCAACGGTGVEL